MLTENHRNQVETVCQACGIRGWVLHAVSARSNHVHLAVTADKAPKIVRDQFKANEHEFSVKDCDAIKNEMCWGSRGGDAKSWTAMRSLNALFNTSLKPKTEWTEKE